ECSCWSKGSNDPFGVETLNLGFTSPSPFGQNNHCGFFIGCHCIGPNPILKRIRDGTVDVRSKYFVCTYSPCSIGMARIVVPREKFPFSVGTEIMIGASPT